MITIEIISYVSRVIYSEFKNFRDRQKQDFHLKHIHVVTAYSYRESNRVYKWHKLASQSYLVP